jgi:hypothetical protein
MMPAIFRSAPARGRLISQVMLSRLVGASGAWPSSSASRPVNGGAQFAAAPGQAHAARANALQRALQALDGAIDPPRFPHDPQHG